MIGYSAKKRKMLLQFILKKKNNFASLTFKNIVLEANDLGMKYFAISNALSMIGVKKLAIVFCSCSLFLLAALAVSIS